MTALLTDAPSRSWRFGRRHPLYVRREDVIVGLQRPVRLLYASDLHLTGTDFVSERVAAAVAEERPDAVLLGGDLVEGAAGRDCLERMIKELVRHAPVLAVEGNHDRFWGVSAVRAAVRAGGGHWLLDEPVLLGGLRLVARTHAPADEAPTCLVGHDPADLPAAASHGVRLVLAGHLHGGQLVLGEHGGRLYPGAFLYRWNGLRFLDGGTTMLVSRGVSDTLPVRFACPTEVLSCTVS